MHNLSVIFDMELRNAACSSLMGVLGSDVPLDGRAIVCRRRRCRIQPAQKGSPEEKSKTSMETSELLPRKI